MGGKGAVPFSFNKLPLTIKADNKTMYYSHTMPTFTVSYTGFITGADKDNALTINTVYTATTVADGQTVGTYDITISGSATAKNYTIATEKGTLTVLGDKQLIATDIMPTVPTEETVVIPAPSDGGSTGGGGGSTAATTYTITATAGAGGTLSTGEKVQVREGDSAGFTIIPSKGYQIADVRVNGKSIGAKNSYVFTNVRSNQTIHATFKQVVHANPQTGVAVG